MNDQNKVWRYFFLCPHCHKLASYWIEFCTREDIIRYKVFPRKDPVRLDTMSGEEEFYRSNCPPAEPIFCMMLYHLEFVSISGT